MMERNGRGHTFEVAVVERNADAVQPETFEVLGTDPTRSTKPYTVVSAVPKLFSHLRCTSCTRFPLPVAAANRK